MIKTGDTVRDGRGRAFQVGQLLGRGIWGRSYAAREDGSESEWVVKVPYGEADLPAGEGGLASVCREAFDEVLRLLQSAPGPGLAEVETHFVLEDGTPIMVLRRYPLTFEDRLSQGCSLEELLKTVMDVAVRLQAMAPHMPCHGNLKPSNILLDERGQPYLSDPMSPALRRGLTGLMRATQLAQPYLPPEVRHGSSHAPIGGGIDSYSLSLMVYRGAAAVPGEEGLEEPSLPLEGLDKARMVELKDRVLNRLKREHSNPRFHTRMSDRAAALLNRGLSRETSPSPPYRFRRLDELVSRMEELLALVHPAVSYVGRMVIPQQNQNDGYPTGEDVTFSCTVACTPGVETQDEIACGLAVFDTERDERIRDVACAYTVERHPSGRFRFSFQISELPPGQFRVRTAFTLRESGDAPMTSEVDFRVHPSPGYVPPIPEPESRPLELNFERAADGPVPTGQEPDGPAYPEDNRANIEAGELHSLTAPLPEPEEPDFPMPTPIAPPTMTGGRPASSARTSRTAEANVGRDEALSQPPTSGTDSQLASGGPELSKVEPEPAEPAFQGTGRWSDLPLPAAGNDDLPTRKVAKTKRRTPTVDEVEIEPRESEGPVGDFIARVYSMIKGDQFVLFIGAVAIVIILLAVVLLSLKS